MINFSTIFKKSFPAGSENASKNTQKVRKSVSAKTIVTPESYNLRGASVRRTANGYQP